MTGAPSMLAGRVGGASSQSPGSALSSPSEELEDESDMISPLMLKPTALRGRIVTGTVEE
jgi:hypothetical protein